MAAGTISAGMFGEEYDIHDRHSSIGVVVCMVAATLVCLVVRDTFQGLVLSQALLSLQLPITVFLQVYLTSSERVMGRWKNSTATKVALVVIGVLVTVIDVVGLVG